ncbi:MAG TPA: hypothetical protein VJO15_04885, partial [Dehalococcoidia bacterium]|nr:hypothetical protein [Dehalococcoidia bacterium]
CPPAALADRDVRHYGHPADYCRRRDADQCVPPPPWRTGTSATTGTRPTIAAVGAGKRMRH